MSQDEPRVLWCLHCERVFRSLERDALELECPYCDASGPGDIWLYTNQDNDMPPALLDTPEVNASAMEREDLQPFFRYCATCHLTREQFPPNFLAGDAARVAETLRQCAPRMLVRLSAWRTPAEQRVKSPMPPATALQALGTTAQQWAHSPELEGLRAYVEALSRASGQPSDIAAASKNGYEALPRCLPAEK